jgi:hypothetical protein
MVIFKTCPHCGSNLDPGEKCECLWRNEVKEEKAAAEDLHLSEREEETTRRESA